MVTPCVGVWIEMAFALSMISCCRLSLPVWECGLKCHNFILLLVWRWSLPVWECGLKSLSRKYICFCRTVTPCVGVWIEIRGKGRIPRPVHRSLPVWECGLKSYLDLGHALKRSVTPCVGVWIEIKQGSYQTCNRRVTPCVGVWIEIGLPWVVKIKNTCHSLCGSVDWNFFRPFASIKIIVTPCVGVWIEIGCVCADTYGTTVTPCVGVWIEIQIVHFDEIFATEVTPCVGVWIEIPWGWLMDWFIRVTPCVGVWIEINCHPNIEPSALSLPVWECGLKYQN